MKALLLPVLLLSLGAALQAQDDPLSFPEGEANITGTWYTQAEVINWNVLDWDRVLKAFPMTITALGGGNLEINITLKIGVQCYKKKILMEKTVDLDTYITIDGKNFLYVEEIPITDHIIIYCEDLEKLFRTARLLGRTPEQSPEALEEFRKFTQHKRLPEKNIFLPRQMDEQAVCPRPPRPRRAAHVPSAP